MLTSLYFLFFFFNDTATTEIYTLSLHDALPISQQLERLEKDLQQKAGQQQSGQYAQESRALREAADQLRELQAKEQELERKRSEEHTSELQSPCNLVCRLLLEKKKKN